jgi:predicted AAA+ superfamily ATPase
MSGPHLYRRAIEDRLRSVDAAGKVRLIFGARQTGKTVPLRRLLPASSSQVFDLADSTLRRRLEADPAAFRREVQALPRSISHVAVDEIQKVPALLLERA